MPFIWQGEAYDFPADPETGVTTVRLTSSLYHHINIYYDRGFSSPDARAAIQAAAQGEPA